MENFNNNIDFFYEKPKTKQSAPHCVTCYVISMVYTLIERISRPISVRGFAQLSCKNYTFFFISLRPHLARVRTKFLTDEFSPVQPVNTEPCKFCVADCSTVCCSELNCTVPRVSFTRKADPCKFLSVQKFVWTRVNRFSVTIMVTRQHFHGGRLLTKIAT